MKTPILSTLCSIGLIATSSAVVVFTDSFESPDVTGSTTTVPTNWTGSSQGFGSGGRGLADEDLGTFTTPFGTQAAYADFAQNSGFISDSGLIATVSVGDVYTLTLNLSGTSNDLEVPYTVSLLALASGDLRNDVRTGFTGSRTLASFSGTTSSSDFSDTATVTYTVEAGDAFLGDDVAVLLRTQESSVLLFDNVAVDVIPEPSAALLGGLGTLLLLRRRRA